MSKLISLNPFTAALKIRNLAKWSFRYPTKHKSLHKGLAMEVEGPILTSDIWDILFLTTSNVVHCLPYRGKQKPPTHTNPFSGNQSVNYSTIIESLKSN